MGDLRCRTCGEAKPEDEFRPSGQNRRRSECRACGRAAARAYGVANRDRRNARLRAWRTANPEKAHALDKRRKLRRLYDISEEEHSAMLARFDGIPRLITYLDQLCHADVLLEVANDGKPPWS